MVSGRCERISPSRSSKLGLLAPLQGLWRGCLRDLCLRPRWGVLLGRFPSPLDVEGCARLPRVEGDPLFCCCWGCASGLLRGIAFHLGLLRLCLSWGRACLLRSPGRPCVPLLDPLVVLEHSGDVARGWHLGRWRGVVDAVRWRWQGGDMPRRPPLGWYGSSCGNCVLALAMRTSMYRSGETLRQSSSWAKALMSGTGGPLAIALARYASPSSSVRSPSKHDVVFGRQVSRYFLAFSGAPAGSRDSEGGKLRIRSTHCSGSRFRYTRPTGMSSKAVP